jgi:hypothetical protein
MNNSTGLNTFRFGARSPGGEEGVLRGARAATVPYGRSADNDESCAAAGTPTDSRESWVRRSLATKGFGEKIIGKSSFELEAAARAYRSRVIGEAIRRLIARLRARMLRAYVRHRRDRTSRLVYDALRELDDQTLQDLGFHRDELGVGPIGTDEQRRAGSYKRSFKSIAKRIQDSRPRNADERYLAAATDNADLERRMKAIERAAGTPSLFVTFNH